MNERELGPVTGPLLRSRLHMRCGKRRLRENKTSAGIATLYDAVAAAMESYIAAPEHAAELDIRPGENVNDEKVMYAVLVRSGVLDGTFDFSAFDRLMETALHQELPGNEYQGLVLGIERLMAQLHVMPFDESALPPEKPDVF